MYQGKFSKKKVTAAPGTKKGGSVPSMPPLEVAPAEVLIDQLSIDDILREMSDAPLEPQFAPAPQPAPVPQQLPVPQESQDEEDEDDEYESAPAPGKVAFLAFTCILSALVVLLAAFVFLIRPLQQKMEEEIQVEQESNYFSVFQQMFDQLDWATIYALADVENSPFENRESYAQCMNTLVAGKQLQYALIPSASNLRCYCVMLGDTQLASFTLRLSDSPQGGTDMTLESVQLLLPRTRTVTVEKPMGYTVLINGIPLDDSYTQRTFTTVAGDYLPQGVTTPVFEQQTVTGLMLEPKVAILDRQGQSVVLTQDPQTGVYSPAPASNFAEWEKSLLVSTATSFARYVFGRSGVADLRSYFSLSAPAYQQALDTESPVGNVTSYQLDQNSIVITEYYRYSETVFSAQVSIRVAVLFNNGLSEDVFFTRSFLFERSASGNYLVTQLSAASFQQRRESIKLTFCHNDQILGTVMVPTGSQYIDTPSAPQLEGKRFLGWARRTEGGSLHMVLTVDATGAAVLTGGATLEPMTLFAVYE